MSDLIPIRAAQPACATTTRQIEAVLLRRVINEGRVSFHSGESEQVAARIDSRIGQGAAESSRTVTSVCQAIWPSEINPAKRRHDLKALKKASKLMEAAGLVAQAIGANHDDLLLDAFRGTRFDDAVAARMAGIDGGTDVEDCWRVLSETIHKLAQEVTRTEGLDRHQRSLIAVAGAYDLATESLRPDTGPLLHGPLANCSVFNEEYPPIPSIVLFKVAKSETAECSLTIAATGERLPVSVTVLREVRLTVGPTDNVLEPRPLFEFRSVLDLVGPNGQVPILRPWHDLEDPGLTIYWRGTWQPAALALPTAPVTDAHFVELLGPDFPARRFPAALEAPLQFEHHDIVWRPVTAATCRDLLLRPEGEVHVEWTTCGSHPHGAAMACPPHSLGQLLERALAVEGADGIARHLRAEAHRMVELVRGWQAQRISLAEAAHQKMRENWEAWS